MAAVTLRLSKHHSNGNDFLVALVSEPHSGAALTVDTSRGSLADPSTVAEALCHRRRGVGADGLVLGVGSDPVRMRLWNSDGSEAEISGNGLRCLAQALTRGTNEIDIEIDTPAGPRRCRLEPGADSRTATGRVEMGAVTLDALDDAADSASSGPDFDHLPAALALVEGFTGRWRSGSVGNPHMVVEVADPYEVDLEAAGPAVEACFVGGANVHFAAATGPRRVRMRIWERGAGVTEACGSGAAVAAAAFAAWDWNARTDSGDEGSVTGDSAVFDAGNEAGGIAEAMPGGEPGPVAVALSGGAADEVIVAQPGGETRVHLGPPVALTGPVVHVADIEIEIAEMPGMPDSTPGHWSG